MAFELKGKIKVLFEQQDFPSGFYKRDFVITTNEQYPQDIKLSALKERVEQLNGLDEGDNILVKFDLRGREYNGNYYVDLNAWRIERDELRQENADLTEKINQLEVLAGELLKEVKYLQAELIKKFKQEAAQQGA